MIITVTVTHDNGERIGGYTVHSPIHGTQPQGFPYTESDFYWTAYDDDGHGNGNALGEEFESPELSRVLQELGARVQTSLGR